MIIIWLSLIISIISIGLSIYILFKNRKDTKLNPKLSKNNNLKDIKLNPKLSKNDIINLKEGQKKMSNMLKEFDRICRKYNFRYFIIAGSLIGALVYKGWIPWDGDIDLQIHEDDFPKLIEALKKELPDNMWFQNNENDKNYPKNTNIPGKIRDLDSCYIEYTNNKGGEKWHNGVQIDLLIYEEKGDKIHFRDNKKITNLTKDDIYPLKRVKFENIEVYIMNNPEKYLDQHYGKNWREILPIDKRYPHEGKIDGFKTCPFHYKKYPKLHSSLSDTDQVTKEFFSHKRDAKSAFENVYKTDAWGKATPSLGGPQFSSGSGADADNCSDYLNYVKTVIDSPDINSIVEVGCGDLKLTKSLVNPTKDYTCIDVASQVKNYADTQHINVIQGDASTDPLPHGDLLIIKDVLQHWPNAAVKKFEESQMGRFKQVIVTNDAPDNTPYSRKDIAFGEFSPLTLQGGSNVVRTNVCKEVNKQTQHFY